MRKGFFGSLAALVLGGGVALGQSYPAASPYVPTQDMPRPKLLGWPPAPGAIPTPPGTSIVAPGQYEPAKPNSVSATTIPTDVKTMPPSVTGVRITADNTPPAAPVLPDAAPTAPDGPVMIYMPANARGDGPHGHKKERNPAPGSPLMCDESCGREPVSRDIPLDRYPLGYRGYGKADFLIWWTKPQSSPTLVQVGSNASATLVDANDFDDNQRLGGRLTLGRWLGEEQRCAIEGTILILGQREPQLTLGGELFRPFVSADTGNQILLPVGLPGGTQAARLSSLSRLWSGEINARHELWRCGCSRIDLLAGGRYLEFDENLNIDSTGGIPGEFLLVLSDRFGTHNTFWGGQLGIEAEACCGRLSFDFWAKAALGVNHELVNIQGNSVFATPTTQTSVAGGVFAQPSNIGRHTRDQFTVVPEFGINMGYRITDNIRISAGYSILLLVNSVRPGDQIDTGLSETGARPAFRFNDSTFWAQGVAVGLEFRY